VESNEVWFARNQMLLYAKAYGLQSIDSVQINFNDSELLRRESVRAFEIGYTGKQIIHPNQIQIVHDSFSPNIKTLQWAQKVMDAWTKHSAAGTGAFTLDNKVSLVCHCAARRFASLLVCFFSLVVCRSRSLYR
jgi:citrate lyase subunit beta-like protein